MNKQAWTEYDSAAEWCAKRGHDGTRGTPLPMGLSSVVAKQIYTYPEAFETRIKLTAYELAMERRS